MRRIVTSIAMAAQILLLIAGFAGAQDSMGIVSVGGNDDLGAFLVDANGMTLYTFTNDTPSVSTCSGDCLANWPALTVESADALVDISLPGEWGVHEREDGALQVTYNRWPLYTWVNDAAPGDATGQGVGERWWVARPQTVALGGNDELGSFLVDANGMTLYMFTNDTEGVSNCSGDCLANWPALTVSNEDELYSGLWAAAPGDLGVITRDDGALQVTYQGMPLYTWVNDAASGDATGQGVGDRWYVVKPTLISVGSTDELGEFIVGPDGMTLYLFAVDADGVSECYDQCAVAWPPLLVRNESDLTAGEGVTGVLGTTERTDGTLQATYNNLPLYGWIFDGAPGDTTGEGVRDVWYVIPPSE
jgi:predicted lipoprotein with Yx(FWY)xxD motif